MRIGIDARLLQGDFTGDRTYWRGLIRGLSRLKSEDEFVLYTYPNMSAAPPSETAGLPTRDTPAMCWRTWSLWAFPRALDKDRVDVAHVQYSIPPFAPCPVISSVHDISFRTRAQYYRFKDKFLLHRGFSYAAKHAAKILAISLYTKSEIVNVYGVAPERVEVVYSGVDEQFRPLDRAESRDLVRRKYAIASPFVVTVGLTPERKNVQRLIQAFAQSKEELRSDHKLVLVGRPGGDEGKFTGLAESLGISEDMIITGYVPSEDLPSLYNAADLCVYPSVYEGFGLPAAEAMACGVPVITGDRSSLPEVVGGAGITVDPYQTEAFAEAIARVLSSESLRAELSAKGPAQAAKFSWDTMARQVVDVYHRVGG